MTGHCAQKRVLGRTGFEASVLGIGDLADRSMGLEDCVALARRALDAGLNVLDTAPGYENGFSEQVVGAAVREHGSRDALLVIDKIDSLDSPVEPQVDESLRRLGLDYADVFVLHGLSSLEDWRSAAREGGSMDQLGEAARRGKMRFRGISSHDPQVLMEAIASGLCDVVMFAVGPYCDKRYITEVLPLARSSGVGTVCFKTFGAGKLLADTSGYGKALAAGSKPPQSVSDKAIADNAGPEPSRNLPHLTVEACLHYTLSRDPDVTLLGLSSVAEQDAAFSAADRYDRSLSEDELLRIEAAAQVAVSGKGPCWWDPMPHQQGTGAG